MPETDRRGEEHHRGQDREDREVSAGQHATDRREEPEQTDTAHLVVAFVLPDGESVDLVPGPGDDHRSEEGEPLEHVHRVSGPAPDQEDLGEEAEGVRPVEALREREAGEDVLHDVSKGDGWPLHR